MKLYVLTDEDGSISAISESKKDINKYKQKKTYTNYLIHTVVDEAMVNELLLHYDELYVENYSEIGLVMTRAESLLVEEILGEEKMRLKTTRQDIKHYLTNYSLKKNEEVILKESLKVISKLTKKKRLIKTIELDKFIAIHSPLKKVRERLALTARQMYIFITQKD